MLRSQLFHASQIAYFEELSISEVQTEQQNPKIQNGGRTNNNKTKNQGFSNAYCS